MRAYREARGHFRNTICAQMARRPGFGGCLSRDRGCCIVFGRSYHLEKPTRATALQGSGTRSSAARILFYEGRQALLRFRYERACILSAGEFFHRDREAYEGDDFWSPRAPL